MKQRIQTVGWLAAFLALALLWVSPAMATDYELYIAGTQVTSANCNNLKDIAGVTVAEGGVFQYDPATKTLTMKEVTVSVGDNKIAISNQGVEGLKIDVSGTNSLKATNWSALDCSASTELKGNGSLTIDGNNSIAVYVKKNAYHFRYHTCSI